MLLWVIIFVCRLQPSFTRTCNEMDFDMFSGNLVYIPCQTRFHFMSRSSTSLSAAILWLERANVAQLVAIRRLNRLGLEITGSRLLALRGELSAVDRV